MVFLCDPHWLQVVVQLAGCMQQLQRTQRGSLLAVPAAEPWRRVVDAAGDAAVAGQVGRVEQPGTRASAVIGLQQRNPGDARPSGWDVRGRQDMCWAACAWC